MVDHVDPPHGESQRPSGRESHLDDLGSRPVRMQHIGHDRSGAVGHEGARRGVTAGERHHLVAGDDDPVVASGSGGEGLHHMVIGHPVHEGYQVAQGVFGLVTRCVAPHASGLGGACGFRHEFGIPPRSRQVDAGTGRDGEGRQYRDSGRGEDAGGGEFVGASIRRGDPGHRERSGSLPDLEDLAHQRPGAVHPARKDHVGMAFDAVDEDAFTVGVHLQTQTRGRDEFGLEPGMARGVEQRPMILDQAIGITDHDHFHGRIISAVSTPYLTGRPDLAGTFAGGRGVRPADSDRGMRTAILSTFPPRSCGLATFAADLREALLDAPGVDGVDVVAVTDGETHVYPPPVVTTIAADVRADYRRAARLLGRLGVDVVVIEHEFGIFGGSEGDYVVTFATELSVPYVVCLHTVLGAPTPTQHHVQRELCGGAAAVMVFTETARELVLDAGIAPAERVHVVPHGAPRIICEVAHERRRLVELPLGGRPGRGPATTRGRFVVSSFGLLSAGKGLEVAIDAMARVVADHPEVVLVIAGRTHPEVMRRDGESYRLGLQRRVDELGLSDHVVFDDRFLEVRELAELLAATDVFITPYAEREQIVSGALTFALAAGRPVVSTPYRYAEDLLSTGAGMLVPFGDAAALGGAISRLVRHRSERDAAQAEARRVGASLSWPEVGRATATVCEDALQVSNGPAPLEVDEPSLPPLRLDHLEALVDDVGIVQHGIGAVPDRSTGYCVDDVARLVPIAWRLARRHHGGRWSEVATRSLAFLAHAADNPQRCGMHNLMSYERTWLDHPHHGDHVGRSIWALGELLGEEPSSGVAFAARRLLEDLGEDLVKVVSSPRTAAFAILGLTRPLSSMSPPVNLSRWRNLLDKLAQCLLDHHREHSDVAHGWNWFEDHLAYDNARLPQALIAAGHVLRDPDMVDVGLATLSWWGDHCGLGDGMLRLSGNVGWRRGDPFPGLGDEQALDASALVAAELDALAVAGDARHAHRALTAFSWFLGTNRLGLALYDSTNGGCGDGLSIDHVNANQGAESLLAYLEARLALEAAGMASIVRRASTVGATRREAM